MEVPLLNRLPWTVDVTSHRRALRTALVGIALAAAKLPSAPESEARKNKRKKKTIRPDCSTCQVCPPPWVGTALGEACQTIEECCGNETGLSCGITEDSGGATVCCGTLGAPCGGDADCCLPFFCPEGQCIAP